MGLNLGALAAGYLEQDLKTLEKEREKRDRQAEKLSESLMAMRMAGAKELYKQQEALDSAASIIKSQRNSGNIVSAFDNYLKVSNGGAGLEEAEKLATIRAPQGGVEKKDIAFGMSDEQMGAMIDDWLEAYSKAPRVNAGELMTFDEIESRSSALATPTMRFFGNLIGHSDDRNLPSVQTSAQVALDKMMKQQLEMEKRLREQKNPAGLAKFDGKMFKVDTESLSGDWTPMVNFVDNQSGTGKEIVVHVKNKRGDVREISRWNLNDQPDVVQPLTDAQIKELGTILPQEFYQMKETGGDELIRKQADEIYTALNKAGSNSALLNALNAQARAIRHNKSDGVYIDEIGSMVIAAQQFWKDGVLGPDGRYFPDKLPRVRNLTAPAPTPEKPAEAPKAVNKGVEVMRTGLQNHLKSFDE